MGTLFRIILISVIIYYIAKLIFRFFFGQFIKHVSNTMQDRMNQQERQQQQTWKKPGEVTIDYVPNEKTNKNSKSATKFSKDEGEYVDYEEVKD